MPKIERTRCAYQTKRLRLATSFARLRSVSARSLAYCSVVVIAWVFSWVDGLHDMLNKLYPSGRERQHSEKDGAMFPTLNIGFAVGTFAIMNRHFDYPQSHACRTEDKLEIAKRIEVAEKVPVCGELEIILAISSLSSVRH